MDSTIIDISVCDCTSIVLLLVVGSVIPQLSFYISDFNLTAFGLKVDIDINNFVIR